MAMIQNEPLPSLVCPRGDSNPQPSPSLGGSSFHCATRATQTELHFSKDDEQNYFLIVDN